MIIALIRAQTSVKNVITGVCLMDYDKKKARQKMLTEKELNEVLKEDIENMEDDNIYYQAAVEYTEYCERYEPTYNPDDGSM